MGVVGRVVTFALPCVLAACSDAGSGGSGGGGGGGGVPLVPVACEAGDLDLHVMTPAQGVNVVQPGAVPLDVPIVVAGESGFESAPISICVPEDAVSLIWLPGGEAITTSYFAGGQELVNVNAPEQLIRWISPELSLPKSPELPLVSGRHTLKLGDTAGGELFPVLALRRGARSSNSRMALNLILVDGLALGEADLAAIEQGAAIFDQVYASAGIITDQLGAGTIADPGLAVLADDDVHALSAAQVTPDPEHPLIENAVQIYFVRELLSNDSAGTLLGKSMGVPGAPGVVGKDGVVISVDAHRSGGVIDGNALWVTIAHELGHWHGLRHTSERVGVVHDLIGDTPECSLARDLDENGLVDQTECAADGASNLMFWTYDLAAPPTVLTPGQAFVLSSALTVRPG